MNTKAKSRSAALWIVATLIVLSLLLLIPIIASGADEEAPVRMESGASVRITSPTGLRFTASLSASEYAKVVDAETMTYQDGYEVGMIIVPSEFLTAYRGQSEIEDVIDYFVNAEKNYINLGFNPDQLILNETTGRYEFNGAITNILEQNRTRDFSALAYVEQNGARTYAAEDSDARDITDVATKAIESGKYDATVMDSLATNYGLTYKTVNVTMPAAVGGETETVNIVGADVTFADVNAVLDAKLGYRVSAFLAEGAPATEITHGATYTAASIAVDVNFTYLDGTTESIDAVYGSGLQDTPKTQDATLARLNYAGDYKNLTQDLDVAYTYKSVGNAPSLVFNADGSVTASASAVNCVGVLMNTPDLTEKGWTAEVKVATETITAWQTYGIAVRYGTGNDWLLLGGRKNGQNVLFGQRLVNGAFPPESEGYGSIRDVNLNATFALKDFATADYVDVKVTYNDGNYYFYLNDQIMDIMTSADLGVTAYGAPAELGFGWKIDDFSAAKTPSLTFSDWSIAVEGDGAWTAPTETEDDFMIFIGRKGSGTSLANPATGAYTLTKGTAGWDSRINGGFTLLRGLSGKNWTISTEINVADIKNWDTFGFALQYADGTTMTFGTRACHGTDKSQMRLFRWVNDGTSYTSTELYANADPIAVAAIADQTTLPMTLTYYGGKYYFSMNGVLNGVWTAAEFGVADYGSPVGVGLGGMMQDTPGGSSIRFTNCTAAAGDTVAEPEAHFVGVNQGGYWVKNSDGTYTLTKKTWQVVESGSIVRDDLSGKNWTMEVKYNVADMSKWSTFGFTVCFADGSYYIFGPRPCNNSDMTRLRISEWHSNTNSKTVDFTSSLAEAIKADYVKHTTMDLKLTYYNGEYYLYINGYLVRVIAPADLGMPATSPVAAGFGVHINTEMADNTTLRVSGIQAYAEGESGFTVPNKADLQNGTLSGTGTHWVIGESGTMSYQAVGQEFAALYLGTATSGKNWTATMEILVSSIKKMNAYGFVLPLGDGTFAVMGFSVRDMSTLDFAKMFPICWLRTGGANYYMGAKATSTNATAIAEITSALASAGATDTLKFELAYNATTDEYSFYYNNVLYGTYAASSFMNKTDDATRALSNYDAPTEVYFGGFISDKDDDTYPVATYKSYTFREDNEEEQA